MERSLGVLSRRLYRRAILPETAVVALIGLLDLAHTIFLVGIGVAVEANPLLAPVIAKSWVLFALVKAASFLIPLTIIESIRPLSPKFIRFALRAGAIAYVTVYGLAFLHVNLGTLLGNR